MLNGSGMMQDPLPNRKQVVFVLLSLALHWLLPRTCAQQGEKLTVVSNSSSFLAAFNAGAAHIEVQQHLDLRDFEGVEDPTGERFSNKAIVPLASLKTVRVCSVLFLRKDAPPCALPACVHNVSRSITAIWVACQSKMTRK